MREVKAWLVLFVAAIALVGCKRTASEQNADSAATFKSGFRVLGQFHWVGKTQILTATNTWKLKQIWELPESVKLETQIFDKLTAALSQAVATNAVPSPLSTAALRGILDDLLREESVGELRGTTNGPIELELAVRLPSDRVELWQSNITAILNPLASEIGITPSIKWDHLQDWTLLTLTSPESTQSAPDLSANFRQRLLALSAATGGSSTNYFLELQLDDARLMRSLIGRTAVLPAIESLRLGMFGVGEAVKTRGTVTFTNPWPLPLAAWNIPSNSISQPLISFSALRGLQPYLESLPFWQSHQLGAAPDQIFFWSQDQAPWLHFFTTQSPDANSQFLALKDFLLEQVNPELAPNRLGVFTWATNADQVTWKGVPFCNPTFTRSGTTLQGGFVANAPTNRSLPVEFIQKLEAEPNLVYYDWENSGPQVGNWLQIGQLMRLAFSRAQLAHTNAGAPWLQVLHTNLAFCATSMTAETPQTLAFARSSTVGFSSIELQLLADWFDSPHFPRGLYTLDTPRKALAPATHPSQRPRQ